MNSTRTTTGTLQILAWVLGLLLLALPATLQAQFNYTTEGGTITISGYTGPGGGVVIPDTIDGLPVTSISAGAFRDWETLTSVTIPDNVTSIGDAAFAGCTNLAAATLPSSVTNIGRVAFRGCGSLTSFTIPDGIAVIHGMLSGCASLTNVIIPRSIVSISAADFGPGRDVGAFEGCASLYTVTIPNSVTNLGSLAFANCTSLTNVYCLGQEPALGTEVFSGTTKATVYRLPATTGWGTTFGGRPIALWIPITPNFPSLTSDEPLKLVTHCPPPATVRVQRSANLVDWEDWQTVSRDAGPSGLQDTDTGTTPWRFYRGFEE